MRLIYGRLHSGGGGGGGIAEHEHAQRSNDLGVMNLIHKRMRTEAYKQLYATKINTQKCPNRSELFA